MLNKTQSHSFTRKARTYFKVPVNVSNDDGSPPSLFYQVLSNLDEIQEKKGAQKRSKTKVELRPCVSNCEIMSKPSTKRRKTDYRKYLTNMPSKLGKREESLEKLEEPKNEIKQHKVRFIKKTAEKSADRNRDLLEVIER